MFLLNQGECTENTYTEPVWIRRAQSNQCLGLLKYKTQKFVAFDSQME